ncbi:MAG: amidohydrolase family protein [Propionibacteriales bacterium]|nr:amidohydrolase family protein [Propionibacteriales bacterium]
MEEPATRPHHHGNQGTVIDLHNHYIPAELVADARKRPVLDGIRIEKVDGTEWMVHPQGFRYPVHPGFYDHDSRIGEMDGIGTDTQVVSIAPPMYMYWVDAESAVDYARMANDSLARFARDSGGRMIGVATLPMQDPDAATNELERAVGDLGLRGAEIAPFVEGTPLDDPALVPVLESAQRLGVPLIVHPTYVGDKAGLEDFYLTNLVGNPLETCICAARLIFSGVLDRLSELELVLMHGGGFLPYQIGRLDHGFRVRSESKGCANPPSSYLTRFTYDTITHDARALDFLINLVGERRVAYGTDFPYDMAGGSLAGQLAGIELTAAQHHCIASENTARLFGVPHS